MLETRKSCVVHFNQFQFVCFLFPNLGTWSFILSPCTEHQHSSSAQTHWINRSRTVRVESIEKPLSGNLVLKCWEIIHVIIIREKFCVGILNGKCLDTSNFEEVMLGRFKKGCQINVKTYLIPIFESFVGKFSYRKTWQESKGLNVWKIHRKLFLSESIVGAFKDFKSYSFSFKTSPHNPNFSLKKLKSSAVCCIFLFPNPFHKNLMNW